MRLCYRIYMEQKKQDKRGQYMKLWSPEKRAETMREVARRKWAKIGPKERKAIALKLTESRKAKNG